MSNEEKIVPSKDTQTDAQKTGEQRKNFMNPEIPPVRKDAADTNQMQPKKDVGGTGVPQEPKK